jgi:signal transduction histidine kinase
MMGGDISVISSVGQGSSFVITLPERIDEDIMAAFY